MTTAYGHAASSVPAGALTHPPASSIRPLPGAAPGVRCAQETPAFAFSQCCAHGLQPPFGFSPSANESTRWTAPTTATSTTERIRMDASGLGPELPNGHRADGTG